MELQEQFLPYSRSIENVPFPYLSLQDISRSDMYVAMHSYAFRCCFVLQQRTWEDKSKTKTKFTCSNCCSKSPEGKAGGPSPAKVAARNNKEARCAFQVVFERSNTGQHSHPLWSCSVHLCQFEHTCDGAVSNFPGTKWQPLKKGGLVLHLILAEAMLEAGWMLKLLEEPGNEHAVEDFCSKMFGLKMWGNKLAPRVKEKMENEKR